MNASKCLSIALLLLVIQGCRITQIVPEGGAIVSRTGTNDCAAGQTCVIEVAGVPFSDTFTAVPEPGYKFTGWKQSLCNNTKTPCVLENVAANLTAIDVDTYLEPIFVKLDLLELLPQSTGGVLQIYPGIPGAMDTNTSTAIAGMGPEQILHQYTAGFDIAGAAERVLLAQMRDAPGQFVLLLKIETSGFAALTANAGLTALPPQGYPRWAIAGSDLQLTQLNDEMVAVGHDVVLQRIEDVYTGVAEPIANGVLAEYLPALAVAGVGNSFVYGLPALYGAVSAPGNGNNSLSQAKAVNGVFGINGDTLNGAINFFKDNAGVYTAKVQQLLTGLNAPVLVPIGNDIVSAFLNGLSAEDDLRPLLKTLILDMDAVDYAGAVAHGGNPPWLNFNVGVNPGAIFINFEFKGEAERTAFEATHLPQGFTLAPIPILDGETPRYFLVLNMYQSSGGLVEGARAEWSVFVNDPAQTAYPYFLVVEAKAENISADSVNLLTLGEPVAHVLTEFALDSYVGELNPDTQVETDYFTSNIVWPQTPENHVSFDRSFMPTNDFVFWGNGVADRLLYNTTAHNADAVLVNPSQFTFEDNSVWAEFVNPAPVHAVVYLNHQEVVVSPWWNLDANYLDVTPAFLTELINFKNGFYPFTVQNMARDAIRGSRATLRSGTIGETAPVAQYHFVVSDPAGLLTAASGPAAPTAAAVALFEGEPADYYLTLSVYRRDHDPCGYRAEWITYVAGPDGRPDSLRLSSFAAEACLDPVSLMTVATDIDQSINGDFLDTRIDSPAFQFEATVNLSLADNPLAGQNWLEAGDRVCSLNDICDHFFYDGQLLLEPVKRVNTAAVQLLEIETPWDAYIDTNTVRAGVRVNTAIIAFNPWRNLRSFAAETPAP